MKITVGGRTFTAAVAANKAVDELCQMLPLTCTMRELNENEKYCYLEKELAISPEPVGRVEKGDVMLFGTDCLVIFYKGFPTEYSYTKIGCITETEGLEEALGKDNPTVTFTR